MDQSNFGKIPAELKARPKWVLWKSVIKDSKPTKIPYCPQDGSRKAETNNPVTWGAYETAITKAGFHGIGYVFSADDPYTGIDLDNCRDPGTGEIELWARDIIDRLKSYCEISPSGRGVHIILKGKVPSGGNSKGLPGGGKIEIYSQGRYFTMTGLHLKGTPTTIENRQAELTALHNEVFGQKQEAPSKPLDPSPGLQLPDEAIIARAKAAQNGDKFDRLMQRNISEYDNDDSRADLALCSILAFWIQDPEQIDRIFRQSGLMRDKWDERHFSDGRTYGQATIQKALDGITETYQEGPGRTQEKSEPEGQKQIEELICDVSTFNSIEFPEKRYIIEPWLIESNINMIYGLRGVGKTMFALGVLVAATTGESFGPWQVKTPVPCLYLDGEMAPQDTQNRLMRFPSLNNSNRKPLIIYCDAYMNQCGLPRANLLNDNWRTMMQQLLIANDIKLWVVDNIASLAPGIDENSKQEWDPINQWFLELRFAGINTIFLHHTNKDGGQRGTSGREDNIDISILLEKPKSYAPEDGARFIVSFQKSRIEQKFLPLITDMEFALETDKEDKYFWTFASVKKQHKVEVIKMLDEGMIAKDVAEELGLNPSRVSQIKTGAVKEGLLTKEGKLTQSGFAYLSKN